MIGILQYLIVFSLLPKFGVKDHILFVEFLFISLGCIIIAAAGNVINDFFDLQADAINCRNRLKIGKNISEKSAINYYFFLNLLGFILVSIGLFMIDQMASIFLFIGCGFLLYLYSKFLKGRMLIGNILVSLLIVISLLIIPYLVNLKIDFSSSNVIEILISLSVISFLLNLVRELNKDLEDIKGDYAAKYKTLPIVVGRKTSHRVLYFFLFLSSISTLHYYYFWIPRSWVSFSYFLSLIFFPIVYILIEYQKSNINYKKISLLLKFIMLFGLGSIWLI